MSVTNYVWDEVNDSLLMETDENGDTTAEYTQEPGQFGGLVSERRGDQTHFYHYDGLGSTRQLTDAAGQTTDTYVYDAYGSPVQSTGTTVNPFRYVGRVGYFSDAELLQYYIRARHYSPDLARWLSVDPIGYRGGINLYGYVGSSPVSRNDWSGLAPLTPRPDEPGMPAPPRGNYCGQLSMRCKTGVKLWPVYGNSTAAGVIIGTGCVTLIEPNRIICSGGCSAIKTWVSAGAPLVPLLDHEACHACAFEDSGKCKYWYTALADVWGYCDTNSIISTPLW